MSLAIVIPCFNEADRLPLEKYRAFLKTISKTILVFVDDGSEDGTSEVLHTLQADFLKKIEIVALQQNSGKAEAVRQGMLFAKTLKIAKLAFLDADISTSLEECVALSERINTSKKFVFGSRILTIGNHIERKTHRFLIGRMLATIISKMIGLKVYDTQCGCKIFASEIVSPLFEKPFLSRWLFDVEIFKRMILLFGKEGTVQRSEEVPLKRWVDTSGSKVKWGYFFTLWSDLLRIHKSY